MDADPPKKTCPKWFPESSSITVAVTVLVDLRTLPKKLRTPGHMLPLAARAVTAGIRIGTLL